MFVLSLTAPLTACLALLDLQPLGFEPADSGADERRADDAPNDTSVPSDGGIDAANHCSDGKRHDFCDDFEGITGALEDRWQKRKEVNGTGLVATEITDAAPSPVTVFRSTSERGAEGGTTAHVARLSRQESPWPRTPAGAQPGVRIFFEV